MVANIVLASASPRRRRLLKRLGIKFKVCPSQINESQVVKETPVQTVQNLAQLKAATVAQRSQSKLVIGADTVVSWEGEILEKPATPEEASQMLSKLAGRWHRVFTGLALLYPEGEIIDYQQTRVKFRALTNQEISQYIESGEPMDKAGGYGIQAKGALLVEKIEGCYYNVVGLPLARLVELLASLGIEVNYRDE